jgi:hypothetical protein
VHLIGVIKEEFNNWSKVRAAEQSISNDVTEGNNLDVAITVY